MHYDNIQKRINSLNRLHDSENAWVINRIKSKLKVTHCCVMIASR